MPDPDLRTMAAVVDLQAEIILLRRALKEAVLRAERAEARLRIQKRRQRPETRATA